MQPSTRPLILLALVLVLVGCAAPAAVAPEQARGGGGYVPAPMTVEIPAIGAGSTLVDLGLNPDGTLAVPPITEPGQASWYRHGNAGVIPGQDGPALVVGHRSGRSNGVSVPGVFARLDELSVGDRIEVERSSGPSLTFIVYRSQQVRKDAFPWQEVVGDVDGPELRLITCSGIFQSDVGSYTDNLVIYARLM